MHSSTRPRLSIQTPTPLAPDLPATPPPPSPPSSPPGYPSTARQFFESRQLAVLFHIERHTCDARYAPVVLMGHCPCDPGLGCFTLQAIRVANR